MLGDGRSLCDLPAWAVKRFDSLPMAIDLRMLNSVLRVGSAGSLLGTGSIVGVPSEADPRFRWPYVVTAHHVIENQIEVALEVPDPLKHGTLFDPIPCAGWRQPLPNIDLAIAPFPIELVPRFQAFRLEDFVPEGTVVPLGNDMFYLGIFAGPDVPMARAATMGALEVPIADGGYRYNADLVDCRSYGGFSGSPCVAAMRYALLNDEPQHPGPGVEVPPRADGTPRYLGRVATAVSFCGVFTAHYSDEAVAEGVVSRYGVGVMLPCDYVRDALMTDEAQQERREWDEKRQRSHDAGMPPLEHASASDEPSEYERFEELTRQLVKTPKPRQTDD